MMYKEKWQNYTIPRERKIIRFLQLISGIHRIHHIRWSYGWKFWFLKKGYFDTKGWQKLDKSKYHNCTITGNY